MPSNPTDLIAAVDERLGGTSEATVPVSRYLLARLRDAVESGEAERSRREGVFFATVHERDGARTELVRARAVIAGVHRVIADAERTVEHFAQESGVAVPRTVRIDDLLEALGEQRSGDLDLWPRIEQAIHATTMSRADAEWQWPRCHKKNCQGDHGDIEFVFGHMAKAIAENVRLELLCKATTEPDDD